MSPYQALFGVKPRTGLNAVVPPELLEQHEILTEEDLNDALGIDFSDEESSQDTLDEEMPSITLLPETSQSQIESDIQLCFQCQREVGGSHGPCVACGRPVHGVDPCGAFVSEDDEGPSQPVICLKCKTMQDTRDVVRRGQKRQADDWLQGTSKKLDPVEVGDNVLIPVSQFDRGKTDHRNILGIVIEKNGDFYTIAVLNFNIPTQYYITTNILSLLKT